MLCVCVCVCVDYAVNRVGGWAVEEGERVSLFAFDCVWQCMRSLFRLGEGVHYKQHEGSTIEYLPVGRVHGRASSEW